MASVPLSSRQVKIFWARDTGSDFFCIYRAPSAGNRYDSISQTADTSFIDTGLESGTKYLYRVKAGNQHGLSDFSNIGSAITEIDKPSILSAELIRTDSIRITWNRINGAKSYKIYRVDSSFESTATVGSFLVNETPDTHWVDNIPVVKAVYNYVVEAVDFDFHSKFSDSASIAVRSGWTSLGPPGFSPGQAINLNLSVDNGVPIVSFIDLDFSKRISVMKWDGATWGFLGERGVSDGVVDYVSLSVENGIPSVAYCDYSQTYKASVKRFSQGAWIATGQLGFSAGAVDYPCISVSNGTPFVAYVDYQPNGTKKATVCRFDGTTWNPLAGPGICSNRLNSLVSLKLSGDVPFMAGVSDFSELNRAQVRRFAGTSWELFGDSVISLAGAVNPALALENGTAYVSFTDETNSNRITVVKSGGNGWETIGSPGMSVASAGFSSIAVENGIVYVAYIEINSNEPSYRISVRRHRNNIWEYLGSPGNSRGLLYAGIPYPLCPTISLFIRNGKVYLAFSDQSSDFKASVFQFEEE